MLPQLCGRNSNWFRRNNHEPVNLEVGGRERRPVHCLSACVMRYVFALWGCVCVCVCWHRSKRRPLNMYAVLCSTTYRNPDRRLLVLSHHTIFRSPILYNSQPLNSWRGTLRQTHIRQQTAHWPNTNPFFFFNFKTRFYLHLPLSSTESLHKVLTNVLGTGMYHRLQKCPVSIGNPIQILTEADIGLIGRVYALCFNQREIISIEFAF